MEKEQEQNSIIEEGSEGFAESTKESDEIAVEITREEFVSFIRDEADKYLTKFSKFYAGGQDKFAFTWHWPAFFLGPVWMAYRKLYVWCVVFIFLSLVPFLGIPLLPFYGLTANYFYYRHAKKKILNVKTTQTFSDSTEMSAVLKKAGGASFLAGVLACAVGGAIHIFIRSQVAQ